MLFYNFHSYIICIINEIIMNKVIPNMKTSLYLILTIVLNSCAELKVKEIKDQVKLISDIYDFYKPPSVMLVHSSDQDNMIEMNIIFKIHLMLSRRLILTSTINIEKISHFRIFHDKGVERVRVKHPMSVILLTSKKAMNKFKQFLLYSHLYETVNLVLFQGMIEKPSNDICLKLMVIQLNLKLDTMILKCYEEDILHEWYSVNENHTSFYEWAKWNSKTDLPLKAKNTLITKRPNLYGKVLRIATVNASNISHMKNGLLDGYFGDLNYMLEKSLNFTSKYVKEETEYGYFDVINRNWSGAIGMVIRKEVDMVVADFSITSERMKVIDYSRPLFSSRMVLFVRKPSTKCELNWTVYFKPFNLETWCSILLFMLVVSIFISCIKNNEKNSLSQLLHHFSKNCFNIWQIYCHQGLLDSPTASSLRLIYFSLFSSAFIISSIYSASLMCNLTIPTIHNPFSSMEGFVEDGSYKLAILRNSSDSDFFANSNDPTLRKMNMLIIKNKQLPLTMQDAFNMVCQEKVAFYVSEIAAKISNLNITCQLRVIHTGSYDNTAMVLQKNSQYTALINHQINKFRSFGILDHLESKTFIKIKRLSVTEECNEMEFFSILLLLAIIMGGSILGMLILFIERYHFYYKYEIKKKILCTSLERNVMETKKCSLV